MHLSYVALHEVTWCTVVWCTQNAPRRQQLHVKPAMPALIVHHFGRYSKETRYKKTSHSCRITCERSESARERTIVLHKKIKLKKKRERKKVINTNFLRVEAR